MSLPEPKIGQVWASFFIATNGNIFNERFKVIGYMYSIPPLWEVERIYGRGPIGERYWHEDIRTLLGTYYVGDEHNKDAPNPNYKPEPAAGQAWMLSGTILKLKEFVPCPDTWIHETGFVTGFGNFKAHEISFIGWYDTSLLVPEEVVDLKRYPHKCPRCKEAAYIGFSMIVAQGV